MLMLHNFTLWIYYAHLRRLSAYLYKEVCFFMDMTLAIILIVVAAVVGLGGGIAIGIVIYTKMHNDAKEKIRSAEEDAIRIYNDTIRSGENRKKEMLLEAKDEIHKSRTEHEKEMKERKAEITKQERRLQQKEDSLDK